MGSETAPAESDTQTDRLMLHYGERGPVELEVWHEDRQEATHIVSEWPGGDRSQDITDALNRAGYRLEAIDDA